METKNTLSNWRASVWAFIHDQSYGEHRPKGMHLKKEEEKKKEEEGEEKKNDNDDNNDNDKDNENKKLFSMQLKIQCSETQRQHYQPSVQS